VPRITCERVPGSPLP